MNPEPRKSVPAPPPRAARRRFAWARLLLWPLVVAALVWLLRGLDPARLASVLRAASWPYAVLAGALDLTANTAARVLRWRALLPPSPRTGRRVPAWELAATLLAALATSSLLPLRAGEAVRTLRLRDRYGYPVEPLVAAQLVERLVEALTLATFGVPLAIVPGPSRRFVLILAAVAAGACAVIAIVLRLGRARAGGRETVLRRLFRRAADAVRLLGGPPAWMRAYAFGLCSDALDLVLISLCAAAVGVHLGVASALAVLLAVNVAIAVPSTPAQVGVLEAGAVLALAGLGVDRTSALAFALVYHAVHVLPVTVAGAVVLALGEPAPDRRSSP
jgi:hypothetical protein